MSAPATAWMPFYVGDYLGDTQRLTTEQHGAYLLLILDYWRNGPAPDDDAVLQQITKLDRGAWRKHRPALERLFQISNGEWRHKRIDQELVSAQSNAERRSSKGRDGANAKWGESSSGERGRHLRSERLAAARAIATHTAGEWEHLKAICGYHCVRCGADETLVKDHIKPIYQGGSDGIDNIQPLCRSCNSSKGPEANDHRPKGWQDAIKLPCKMPAEMPSNASAPQSPTPLSNDNGPEANPDKDFWDAAKGYLGKSKASLIGKWCGEHGQPATAQAITAAMLKRPPDPVAYIQGIFRAQMTEREHVPLC